MSERKISTGKIILFLVLAATLAGLIYFLYDNTFHHVSFEDRVRKTTGKIAESVYLSCQAADESLRKRGDAILHDVEGTLAAAGPVAVKETKEKWKTVDPYSRAELSILVSPLETPRGRIEAIIDEIAHRTGGRVALYVRINPGGDMLQTAVSPGGAAEGVGTLIPAIDPEGEPDLHLGELLQGRIVQFPEHYAGAIHWSICRPLVAAEDGKIVGFLAILVREPLLERLHSEILQTRVGKTGYVYVLRGSGTQRGCYVISKGGERDGENIWNWVDSAGRPFIQKIIRTARSLHREKSIIIPSASERYPWRNQGEAASRYKSVSIVYFEPWDWVIGAGYYDNDF